jgi:Holliday junction resolvase
MSDSSNPMLRRLERTKNLSGSHRRAPKQERELAKSLRGSLTPASGARDTKGDVRIKGIARIEAKTTKNKSYSLTVETVHKIEEAATKSAEVPVIVIEFNDGQGKKLHELAVMPMYALQTLIDNQK